MKFTFDTRLSESPFVDSIWRTEIERGGYFTSLAESNWGIVITKQQGKTFFTVRGPETKAMPAPVPENAEIFGIVFKLGTFMPWLPARSLVDDELILPDATSQSFWLNGSAWQFPNYENADTFIDKLVRGGLLVSDPIVDAALQDRLPPMSVRHIQRRFLQSTGLTYNAIRQIKRARYAASLLEQGASILDAVYEAGYSDQPHLTRSLKHFIGQTPAQILRVNAYA
jgi:AraC-like DNA-binding protein